MIEGFSDLKKNLKKDFSQFPEIRTAVLADSASQLFCQALKGYGYTQQLNLTTWEADYDRIYETIMDEASGLYSFKPDFIIIFQSSRKLLNRFN
jgi:predicted enzyme involved in methoxymalonyl-ACP biosynthesis